MITKDTALRSLVGSCGVFISHTTHPGLLVCVPCFTQAYPSGYPGHIEAWRKPRAVLLPAVDGVGVAVLHAPPRRGRGAEKVTSMAGSSGWAAR